MNAIITTVLIDAYLTMLSMQLNGFAGDNSSLRLRILLLILIIPIYNIVIKDKIVNFKAKLDSFSATAAVYLLFLCAYNLLTSYSYTYMIQLVFFPLMVLVTYSAYSRIKSEKVYNVIIEIQYYLMLLLSAMFFIAQIKNPGGYKRNANTIYYVVLMLPFVMQNKSRLKRYFGIGLVTILVFWVGKRTPLIAIFAMILLMKDSREAYHYVFKRAAVICIFAAAVLILNAWLVEKYNIDTINRLMSAFDDGGSGRFQLYQRTIEELQKSSLREIVFGHKMLATFNFFSLGAHNDFLEIVFRIGIAGLCIYMSFYISLIGQIKTCIQSDDTGNANLLISAFIIFAIVSFSSQLIFLPSYIAFIAMECNFAISRHRMREQVKKVEE